MTMPLTWYNVALEVLVGVTAGFLLRLALGKWMGLDG